MCRLLLLVVLFAPVPARAQDATALPVAPIGDLMRDVGRLASWLATHNHDVNAAAARVNQAQAAYRANGLRPNPQVTASLGGLPIGTTNPPGLGLGDTVNYGAGVSQLFEIGKRRPRTEAARLRAGAEQHALSDTLLGSLADARETIARVLYAATRKLTLSGELETARQMVELHRARLERGDVSGIDFDRVQLDAQTLQSDVAEASAALDEALTACASVLAASCEPGDAGLSVVTDQTDPHGVVPPPAWLNQIDNRPDVRSLRAREQAALQDARLATRRRIPDPVVAVGYTRDRFLISGNNPRTLTLNVTVPIAAFDRGQHDARRAEEQARELRETEAATTGRAASEVRGLLGRQASLLEAMGLLQNDALARATQILSSTADAVGQGELSTTDLLLARRARTDVVLRVMELQLQLFLVQNELRQVLGLDAPVVQAVQGATWPTP